MSVARRVKELAGESLVYGLPSVLNRALGFITVPIFSRLLAPSDYGLIGMTASITGLIHMFSVLGLDSAMAIYYYDTKDAEDRRVTVATRVYTHYGLLAVLAGTAIGFSDAIAGRFLESRANGDIVRLMACTVFFNAMWSIHQNLLRIQRRKWVVVGLTAMNAATVTASSVLFVMWMRTGVRGMFLGQLCAGMVFFGINLWLFRHWLSFRWFSTARLRKLLVFGVPLVPASIAYWVIGLLDRFMLEHYKGLSDVGLFSIGGALAAVLGILVQAFQQAWGPFAVSIQEDPKARETYGRILSYFLLVTATGAVALSVFSSEILGILTPKSYQAAGSVVGYLAFGLIGNGVYYIASLGVNLTKQTYHIGWTTMTAAVMVVTANLFLVPRLGMVGAAMAAMLAHWTSAGLLFAVSQRYYPIPYRWRHVAIVLLASAIAIAVGTHLSPGPWWATVALKLVWLCGFATALLLTVVSRAERSRGLEWLAKLLRPATPPVPGHGPGQT